MSQPNVRQIRPEDQYALRRTVLGQGLPPDMPVKPGDDHADTCHVGVFVGDQLVSIASLYREPQPGQSSGGHWRLRGMATLPEQASRGYGRLALNYCIGYARTKGGTRIWCNARENALGFYKNMGFTVEGGPYPVPGHGQRWMLVFDLDSV